MLQASNYLVELVLPGAGTPHLVHPGAEPLLPGIDRLLGIRVKNILEDGFMDLSKLFVGLKRFRVVDSPMAFVIWNPSIQLPSDAIRDASILDGSAYSRERYKQLLEDQLSREGTHPPGTEYLWINENEIIFLYVLSSFALGESPSEPSQEATQDQPPTLQVHLEVELNYYSNEKDAISNLLLDPYQLPLEDLLLGEGMPPSTKMDLSISLGSSSMSHLSFVGADHYSLSMTLPYLLPFAIENESVLPEITGTWVFFDLTCHTPPVLQPLSLSLEHLDRVSLHKQQDPVPLRPLSRFEGPLSPWTTWSLGYLSRTPWTLCKTPFLLRLQGHYHLSEDKGGTPIPFQWAHVISRATQ